MNSMVFGLINMMFPAAGALLGFWTCMPMILLYVIIKKAFGFGMLTAGLPTLCAMANWSLLNKKNMFIKVILQLILPALCMALFMMHPVAGQAWPYALYWVIPMALFFVSSSTFFVALSSTFIAHAVGSIMWLYAMPMTSEQWLALIPLVAVERLVFAGGAALFYAVARWVMSTKAYIPHKTR